MKKLLCIIVAAALVFALAGCAETADVSDNTKDGTVGDGTAAGDMMEDVGDDIKDGAEDVGDDVKDGVNDITGGRTHSNNAGGNNSTNSAGGNNSTSGANGDHGANSTGTAGNRTTITSKSADNDLEK